MSVGVILAFSGLILVAGFVYTRVVKKLGGAEKEIDHANEASRVHAELSHRQPAETLHQAIHRTAARLERKRRLFEDDDAGGSGGA